MQQLEKTEATDRITLGALRRAAEAMGCELVYALVPKSGTFVELAEHPVRDSAARDVKSVVHTMMLEDQKPEIADQLIEDEAQRRPNRNNGNTPIRREGAGQLIPRISTMGELNEYEALNILEARA